MAIFERISDLIKSNVNDLIDRAEDPEKMVKQVIIDMEEELRKTTSALGQAMGSQTQMQKQLDASIAESAKWEARAKAALEAGNEELAKQALNNKVTVDNNVKQYREMVQKMEEQITKIKTQIEEIKVKLEEARAKQDMLIARDRMADTNLQMARTMGDLDSKSATAKMEKMEKKIEQKEAEAQAFEEIGDENTSVENSFEEMEKNAENQIQIKEITTCI